MFASVEGTSEEKLRHSMSLYAKESFRAAGSCETCTKQAVFWFCARLRKMDDRGAHARLRHVEAIR